MINNIKETILFCHNLRKGQRDIQLQIEKSELYRQHEENRQQGNTNRFH
jgi:hypothetical protein